MRRVNGATQDRSRTVPRVESLGPAAAGGLTLAFGVVELLVGFWSAGSWQRIAALLVTGLGAAFLVRGLTQIAARRNP